MFYFLKNDKYLEVLIITAILVGGLTEPFLFNTSFKNLAFIFGGTLLFGNAKERKEYAVASKWNKEFTLSTDRIEVFASKLKEAMHFDERKCLTGGLVAVVCCAVVQMLVVYPKGYVFDRAECADITKEFKYYEEKNPAYEGYARVGEFEAGDMIE